MAIQHRTHEYDPFDISNPEARIPLTHGTASLAPVATRHDLSYQEIAVLTQLGRQERSLAILAALSWIKTKLFG